MEAVLTNEILKEFEKKANVTFSEEFFDALRIELEDTITEFMYENDSDVLIKNEKMRGKPKLIMSTETFAKLIEYIEDTNEEKSSIVDMGYFQKVIEKHIMNLIVESRDYMISTISIEGYDSTDEVIKKLMKSFGRKLPLMPVHVQMVIVARTNGAS